MQDLQKAKQEILERAQGIPKEITNPVQLREGEALFVLLGTEHRKWEKVFKENMIDPAKRHYDEAKERAKKLLEPLANGRATLDALLKTYRRVERERIEKEQAKLNRAHEKKIDRAIEKGVDPLEIAPPPLVQGPAKSADTEAGKIIYRKVYDVEFLNEKEIPDLYMIITRKPNKSAILASLKSGMSIPGCRLIEKEEIAARAS